MPEIIRNIYLWVLLISSIIGFRFIYQNRKFTYLHTLPFFLFYLYCVEKLGVYLSYHYKPNLWLFNYSSVIEICYYSWLICRMYFLKIIRHRVNIFIIFYCIIALINIIFYQGKNGFHSITFGIGSISIIVFCVYYFYQLLLFPTKYVLLKQPQFWICTALLFSFSCGFPLFCLNNFYGNAVSEKIWPIIMIVNNIINIIYYSLFTIGFLCKIKKLSPS